MGSRETRVSFFVSDLKLEGLFAKGGSRRGVVVTHPHPLYGGDMYNSVVEAIAIAYQNMGFNTLRFNFRGVGNSEGQYDNGEGEQSDIKGALIYLSDQGIEEFHLAGYSFGVWVGAKGLGDYGEIKSFVMVSPPVAFLDFSFLEFDPRIQLIISGEKDKIAPVSMIEQMKSRWNPEAKLHVLKGVDHFYWGRERQVTEVIQEHLEVSC